MLMLIILIILVLMLQIPRLVHWQPICVVTPARCPTPATSANRSLPTRSGWSSTWGLTQVGWLSGSVASLSQTSSSPHILFHFHFDPSCHMCRDFGLLLKSKCLCFFLLFYFMFFNHLCFYFAGEKPFSCTDCGKSFARGGQLIVHRRVHTGEKPYKCDKCDLTFTSNGNLKTHMSLHAVTKVHRIEWG